MKNRLMGLETETQDSCSVRYKFLLDDDTRKVRGEERAWTVAVARNE